MTRWLTVPDVAAHFGVHPKTVVNWIRAGYLDAAQVQAAHYTDDRPRATNRGQWRITIESFERFVIRLRGRSSQRLRSPR